MMGHGNRKVMVAHASRTLAFDLTEEEEECWRDGFSSLDYSIFLSAQIEITVNIGLTLT